MLEKVRQRITFANVVSLLALFVALGGSSYAAVTLKRNSVLSMNIKDGQVQKDDNGYTETYDEFHTVKAFNGLGKSVANHKKKGDKLLVVGEIRYSRNERDGRTYYNTDIVAEEIEFL